MTKDFSQPDMALDKSSETSFCRFFESLVQTQGTLRLFERNGGDYYSVHGIDAVFVSEHVYRTATVLKQLGSGLQSCTLSKLNAMSFLKELLTEKQYRIEIWCPDSGKNNSWKISKQASPGNLQSVEDMLFVNTDVGSAPVVLAVTVTVKGSDKIVGVGYTDATTMRRLGICEFVDNETFTNFESIMIQLGVKEVVMPDDSQNYDLKKIKAIVLRCDAIITERRKSEFNIQNIQQDLSRLLESDIFVSALPEMELTTAMRCIAALIHYLDLLADESNFGKYTIEQHDLSQYMRLDAAAVKALNLVPNGQSGPKSASIFGLLDQCKTAQGSRLLGQWIKQPLMNISDIVNRQNLVQVFFDDSQLRQALQDERLKTFPDLHRLARKFQRGSASLQDVVRVYQVVLGLPAMVETLEDYSGKYMDLFSETFTLKFKEYSESLCKLQELVETTIDLAAVENHQYLIKPDFHRELLETRSSMDNVLNTIQSEAEQVAIDLGIEFEKRLKFEKNSQYGYHLRLSRIDANRIRGNRDYIELSTQKAGVLFTTVNLRTLSNNFAELTKAYELLQQNLSKDVISITGSYFPVLELLNQLVAHIDVLVSFADVAISAPMQYVRPNILLSGQGDIILKKARHPCVEVQDDVSFIENDVDLVRNDSVFQIITGPNMGGKSTYIRQIGVIVLMAQIGSFVPCEEASVSIVDSILARVGANDSQLKGISTFMAEMLETASILRAATSNSLIIIDELGRGTSTYDGFGLAWAIAEHIAKHIGCFTLFATHFHELSNLADQVPFVKNLHVSALLSTLSSGPKSLTLLYKVMPGVCDQSFGIHVAELAAFPDSVVKIAKRKAAELEDFSHHDEQPKRVWNSSDEAIQSGSELAQQFLSEASILAKKHGSNMDMIHTAMQTLGAKFASAISDNEFLKEAIESL
ncbi:MSH2 protein [Batrachochytrium dendrobatidis]|nr:MSH2 protein [Batrachochytrium dendrobatidis]